MNVEKGGVLSVLALGEDYDLKREPSRTRIKTQTDEHVFEVFIDARGQKALTSQDMPFPSLREALLKADQEVPEVAEDYSLLGVPDYAGRLTLASIPYLMHDRPFVQGITACHDIAAAIAVGAAKGRRRRLSAA